ncbi:MAG: hypothetical protein IPG66_14010 [Hydrogenophilales bacterium]|nr:hypothetical protein [Hydrogenophilales bacterium]
MTRGEQVLAERRALLAEKLAVVGRLSGHLEFSLSRLAYPLASLEMLDPISLESVSALVERFGKLQDLLSGVFREIAVLSGEDASDMNRVFARMEKIGILASAEQWRAMRVLRNLGAHEYDPNDAGRARFINALAADAPELCAIAARATRYAEEAFS